MIQPALREAYGLSEGSLVVQEQTPEGILIRPAILTAVTPRLGPAIAPQAADLDELLNGVTPANSHEEYGFGPSVGEEVDFDDAEVTRLINGYKPPVKAVAEPTVLEPVETAATAIEKTPAKRVITTDDVAGLEAYMERMNLTWEDLLS